MASCRILLADDDPAIHRMVQRVATDFGHQLIQVKKGVAILPMVLESKPDLIVLDIGFPDADGRDVLAQLKADPRTSSIPVVVWSGRHDLDSERRIAISLGAEDYVEKTDAALLMRKIERLLLRLQGDGD